MTKNNRISARALYIFSKILIIALALCLALSAFTACGEKTPEETTPIPSDTPDEPDTPVDAEPKKRVAITYDDGPQYYNDQETKKIVDELDKYGFTATFFVIGNRIPGGDALSYAVEHGNEIGIHGYTHNVYYDKCTDAEYNEEISKTLAAIQKQLPNYEVKTMRPVGGRITDERVKNSPYAVIQWSVDSDDWNNKYVSGDTDEENDAKIKKTVENVMSVVKDGDIILLHDIWSNTYDATVILLAALDEAGYEVVSVAELLGDDLEAGKEYYSRDEVRSYE